MKRKQKNLDQLFKRVGQVVMYILFNAMCSTILFYGIMTATTL